MQSFSGPYSSGPKQLWSQNEGCSLPCPWFLLPAFGICSFQRENTGTVLGLAQLRLYYCTTILHQNCKHVVVFCPQLLYLLDTLRNAIQKQNLRVSFVHATYIAKVAQQILKPGVCYFWSKHLLLYILVLLFLYIFYLFVYPYCLLIEEHMYLVISKFLLGTQYVDLKRIPDFFRLFYSFELEVMYYLFNFILFFLLLHYWHLLLMFYLFSQHKLERGWLLKVLEEGMRDRLCYELCEQQSIFQALLGFCSSPLCDQPVQVHLNYRTGFKWCVCV